MATKARRRPGRTAAAPGGRTKKQTRRRPLHTGRPVTPEDVRNGAAFAVSKELLGEVVKVINYVMRAQSYPDARRGKQFEPPKLRAPKGSLLIPANKAFLYHAAQGQTSRELSITYNVPEMEMHNALMALALGDEIDPKLLEGVNWPGKD